MASCMDRLSEIFVLGRSKKVADYKKAIKLLLEFYDDDSEIAFQQITRYSKDPKSLDRHNAYSWNDIYTFVHELFIIEIERISKLTGNCGKADRDRIVKLVYYTTNTAKYHLKPKDVVIATLQLLKTNVSHIYSDFYEVYLDVLKKYVLQERSQRILIISGHWRELLKAYTLLLNNIIEKLDYVKVLETIELIIRHGSCLTNLLYESKRFLPVLSDLLENYEKYNIKSTDILFKLTYTVCQQIAPDSRFLLCKFAEDMPLSMINFKGPEEKYKLYLLFIQVHHPNGTLIDDDDNSFHNDKWKAILNLLFKMILNDIRPVKLLKSFIALSSEVMRQRINANSPSSTCSYSFHDSLYIQPKKKRRIDEQEKVIDYVNDKDPVRAWPMIQIAAALYSKYPDCLKSDEYIDFLDIVIKLMNQACKDFSIMESLCSLATVFIQYEKKYEENHSKAHWDKIWDAVLRYLSMSQENIVKYGYILVQNLLTHRKISNPNSLLKLYLIKSIQVSMASIQTLRIFCENVVLPNEIKDCDINSTQLNTNSSLRLELLQNVINSFTKHSNTVTALSIEEFSNILIGFTLKSWYKQTKIFHNLYEDFINIMKNCHDDLKTVTSNDVDRCYLSLELKMDLVFNENIEKNDIQLFVQHNLDNPYNIKDLDYLVHNLMQIAEINADLDKNLNLLIAKTTLMAKIVSNLVEMNMINCCFDEFCLVTQLKGLLSKIFQRINDINCSKSVKSILDIMKGLIVLFQTKYNTAVGNIILSAVSFQALKNIYDISKLLSSEIESDNKISLRKFNALTALALYCTIDIGTKISDSQIKIISTLLKLKKYSLSDKTDILCVITFLEIFINISHSMITQDFVKLLMDFIMELFEEWQKDDQINCCLLKHIPKILDIIIYVEDANQMHNVFLICKLFHDEFAKGKFGQLAHLSLVECLNNIVKHKAFCSAEIEILNNEIFITFVTSPYYLVRLESLKYVYSLFSMKHVSYSRKTDFYNKLNKAVYNIFLVQLNNDEIQEEKLLRSISVVQILGTIICSKSIFQCPALFTLLKIIVDKDIDRNIVTKILEVINNTHSSSKSIVEKYLNYLLTSWCSESHINTFPYILLNCQDEIDFYRCYFSYIFPVLIQKKTINDAKNICEKFDISFEQAFKNCCSNIVPWALAESDEVLRQLQENSGYFESIGSLPSLIKENLEQIIIQTIERLHDLNDFYATFDTTIELPASDPPHYKVETIDRCFEQLVQIVCSSSNSNQSVFYFVMARKPSIFQKMLLHLTRSIYSQELTEYKAKALHQYVYLCSKIIVELCKSYCDHSVTYFVHDIGSTLLHLIKNSGDEFIGQLACKFFHSMLTKLLPGRSEQIAGIVGLCVKTLAPMISRPNERSLAKDVLILLIIENGQYLAEAIENLGSLPSFIKTKNDHGMESHNLRENIEYFLKTSEEKSCDPDKLFKLKCQLSAKQEELEKLYEELESLQGFAEHCASSILHRLIYRLIRLSESTDQRVSLEAAKCLGILGPADLTTLILHPQETQTREGLSKANTLTRRVCELLAEFVCSGDVELRAASSEALYVVLGSPWGADFLTDIDSEDNEYSIFLQKFLYPFKSSLKNKSTGPASFKIEKNEFERTFDFSDPHWTETSTSSSYKAWLASTTSAVAYCFSNFYSVNLVPLFQLNVPFCETTLPRFVSLLVDSHKEHARKICQCINQFFNYHFDITNDPSALTISQVQLNKARDTIRCMLNIVNYLRIQSNMHVKLDFDYLPIAMAAQYCSAYFSSVLYAELWCWSNLQNVRDFDSIPIIDQIYDQDVKRGKIAQDILKEAYVKIGDVDSLYGCGSSHLQNRHSRIPYYTNFRKLDKAVLSHDVEMSVGNSSVRGIVNALRESSLYYTAKHISRVISMETDTMEDLSYDCLWRLGDWSQVTSIRTAQQPTKTINFSVYHYEALKNLHENDRSSLEACLEQAHFCIIKDLCNISLESCKAVYPKLSQLQMLREIEEFNETSSDNYEMLFNKWDEQKYIYNNNFQYIEPILAQRAIMFEIRDCIKNNATIKNALINTQLDIARLAQQQGHFNVAARALETLLKHTDLDEEAENRLLYHEARLAWLRKDEDLARFNLRCLINKDSVKPSLLACALRVYGNWIAESKSANPQTIINKYYEKAITEYLSMSELSSDDLSNGCKARAVLAEFAHEQYLMIMAYTKSSQFESLKECVNYSRNVVSKSKVNDKDIARAVSISSRQTSNDCIEIQNIQKDQHQYMILAVKNYVAVLQDSDEHDLLIFRLVSLWLDNMYDEEVNRLLERHLVQIPSYKFIPLVPQLAPHMSNVADIFSQKISLVLERCAKEHPHHTLPVLLALKNLYNDSKYSEKKITKQEPRVLGAQQLIMQLNSTNIRPIIQEMDKLSDALVMLAYFEIDKKRNMVVNCPIPKKLALNDIKDFQHSMVLTLPIEVKKNGDYTNVISVLKYEENFSNVGGINAPKKVICVGTDGIRRPQLVKGKDDLRQDAVMQQVFTVMNSLLKTNKGAKHRKLCVRTYKVVPLTQRSGVLQWCENTLPLSSILTGDGSSGQVGLHRKYYPNDYAPNECRLRLKASKSVQLRYEVFMDCCKNLRPAFHYFFTENYLSPETWFERRLAYTRSVATTSIIGYILGLGDRHVSNILIDKSTAEVIHIDFGIAFEQGKVLPTPETVPFRLTRDIEVAMGVSGIEGTMRKCCEETMTVLRERREIIVTLLRVLLYDPLYSWAITPAKAATYQSEHSSCSSENKDSNSPGVIETNKLAERALLRVQQKLQGIEEGVASSIAGQVERLIQQARDPTNLSRLFEGWQAYL